MSNGNNYLNIPSKDTLLSTRPAEETDNSAMDDEDDEEPEECYTLMPRSSPVPRRRGLSLFDETVEYMKIRLTLPSRRVSFVDSQGGDLVEVKEFVAFDSDEEEDPRWEIEEARYRPATHEPIYQVCPDFQVPTSTAFMLAVQKNKVEMECVSLVEDDPLSFTGLIRVLNICFNKAVYVRFTMDGWITFFDCPADYVQGSNDVETDQYSFKLSFAAPYTTQGSRIEFVLRYETPEGDYWANNAGKNYAMVLHVSYADDIVHGNGVDDRQLKSILKPANCRTEDNSEEMGAADSAEEDWSGTETEAAAPECSPAPLRGAQPQIDVENKDARPSSPPKTDTDLRIVDRVPLCASASISDRPLSFSAVGRVEVFTPITSQPLTTQPRSESPQELDFTTDGRVVEEREDDSVPGAQTCSYDTETQVAVCEEGSETAIKVSSESNIFCQTTTADPIPLPYEKNRYEKDQDVVEGESDSEPSYDIQEPPISIPSLYKDLNHTDHTLETEPNDQTRQDNEGYLRYSGAVNSYQSLASERPVTAYLGPPEEANETYPEGELSVPREAEVVSQPGGEELAGLDSAGTCSPPGSPKPVPSEEDRPSESPAEPVPVPSPAPVLHSLPDVNFERELAEFDELLDPSGYHQDPMESLLESPVPSVGELREEVSHALLDTMGEITTPADTVASTQVNNVDVVVQSVSHTYSHVPDQGVWEEQAEAYCCHGVGTSDSPPQGSECLEHEEVVRHQATELPAPQRGEPEPRLRQAYVASSAFLTFAFCLVLAFHHLDILPLVLLYLVSIQL